MNGSSGIVVHVTSGESRDWNQALRNLSNLYRDESTSTPPDRIEVVVNGAAVRFLLADSPNADRVARIAAAGVTINVCRNTLDRMDRSPEDLVDGVTTVRSGVAEAVRLQRHDTAYLKLP